MLSRLQYWLTVYSTNSSPQRAISMVAFRQRWATLPKRHPWVCSPSPASTALPPFQWLNKASTQMQLRQAICLDWRLTLQIFPPIGRFWGIPTHWRWAFAPLRFAQAKSWLNYLPNVQVPFSTETCNEYLFLFWQTLPTTLREWTCKWATARLPASRPFPGVHLRSPCRQSFSPCSSLFHCWPLSFHFTWNAQQLSIPKVNSPGFLAYFPVNQSFHYSFCSSQICAMLQYCLQFR